METDYEKLRKMSFETRIEEVRTHLAKKGATQDEIDDYIYSLRCIEELNDKYFAKKLYTIMVERQKYYLEEKHMTAKVKAEQEERIEAVKKAEQKVADLKAEKAIKKAMRQEARLNWKWKGFGKFVNKMEDNLLGICIGLGIGLPIGAGVAIGCQNLINKSTDDEEVDETDSDEAVEDIEAPFEA